MSYASAQSSDSWYTLFGPLSQPVIHLGESFFVDVDGYFNISDDEYITAEKVLKDDAIVLDDAPLADFYAVSNPYHCREKISR